MEKRKSLLLPSMLDFLVGFTSSKLDTPCAAGARSTSSHPAVLLNSWTNVSLSYVAARHFQSSSILVSTRAWNRRKLTSSVFFLIHKKSHIWCSKKGTWTDISHSQTSLTAINFLDRSKSRTQTTGRQKPRTTLQIPLVKINYFPDRSADSVLEVSLFLLPDGKSASRNKYISYFSVSSTRIYERAYVSATWKHSTRSIPAVDKICYN